MQARDTKALKKYIEANTTKIVELRSEALKNHIFQPAILYIGDVLPRKKEELRPSPMLLETGSKIFGMDIIIDFRVPVNSFYITAGRLTDGQAN